MYGVIKNFVTIQQLHDYLNSHRKVDSTVASQMLEIFPPRLNSEDTKIKIRSGDLVWIF